MTREMVRNNAVFIYLILLMLMVLLDNYNKFEIEDIIYLLVLICAIIKYILNAILEGDKND